MLPCRLPSSLEQTAGSGSPSRGISPRTTPSFSPCATRPRPPPSPELAPEQIAAIFGHNTNGIRLGLLMTTLAAAMQGLWVATVTVQMRRIEGERVGQDAHQIGAVLIGKVRAHSKVSY